jgi:hypothetical protein
MIAGMSPVWSMLVLLIRLTPPSTSGQADSPLPAFGRDTVLVYKSSIENDVLVVRIAEFAPDRFVEWEDATTQGTILMPAKAVSDARAFVSWQLFQAGMDTRGNNTTTLWLSRRIFRELKEKQKVKLMIESLPTSVRVIGNDQMAIEVNRSSRNVPVIKTMDERGAERWFLDAEDNPLLVNFLSRTYQQKLTSVTTDRPNTLRWIKKKSQ